MKSLLRIFTGAAVGLLTVPTAALANNISPSHTLLLPGKQIWLFLIAGLVPLVTYVINHVGPWVTEPIKATVLVVVSALTGALYTALTTDQFGWNAPTAQLVVTAIVSALASHALLWKPSGISAILGGGSNRQRPVPPANQP